MLALMTAAFSTIPVFLGSAIATGDTAKDLSFHARIGQIAQSGF